jgi:hypothetical protein
LDDPVNPGSPTARLKALLRGRLRRFEEQRFASRVCNEALAALEAVRTDRPELRGYALYEAVITRRLALDAAAARGYMQRVQDSSDDWETERTPTLIDVVKYMIVSEYLAQGAIAAGTAIDGMALDLGPFLVARIDPKL